MQLSYTETGMRIARLIFAATIACLCPLAANAQSGSPQPYLVEEAMTSQELSRKQLSAFQARAEQLLAEWLQLWPYYLDPEIDSALQAYARQQLEARLAAGARFFQAGQRQTEGWLWQAVAQGNSPHELRLMEQQWLTPWQPLPGEAGYARSLSVSVQGPSPLADIFQIDFALRRVPKQFGRQTEQVWAVRMAEIYFR